MTRQDKHNDLSQFSDARRASNAHQALDAYQASLAIEGDRHAFELLYKRWHPKLLRFAFRQTGDADAAKDIMQDAALLIAKNISRLDDPHKFSAWAYTIVRRRAADHINRKIKDRKGLASIAETAAHVVPEMSDSDLSIRQAMRLLSPEDRLILTLFYVDGLKGPEMAAAMGIPLGTLKSRLFTARGKLKSIYETTPEGDKNA